MFQAERKQFDHELCKRWKGKFDVTELDRWWGAVRAWNLDEVVEALNRFKDASRYVPKIGEIMKLLPRRVGQEKQAATEQPFSQIVASQIPNIPRDAGVIEKITRYWRAVWWGYKSGAQARRESMNVAAQIASNRDGRPIAEITNSKAFVEAAEMLDQQRLGAHQKCWSGCVATLIAEAVSEQDAKNAASWLDVPPDQFSIFLNDLRNVALVDTLA